MFSCKHHHGNLARPTRPKNEWLVPDISCNELAPCIKLSSDLMQEDFACDVSHCYSDGGIARMNWKVCKAI